ncbi:MAG: hypothetical protein V3W52_17130 [Syntrophobacteria bacterium]
MGNKLKIVKVEPKHTVSGLERFSDLDLLRELVSRNKIGPAPTTTTRCTPHVDWLIDVGGDNTADITMCKEAYDELIAYRHK